MTSNYFSCRDCGKDVAWMTSRRTGKRYLAEPWMWVGGDYSLHSKMIPAAHRCTPNPLWKQQRDEQVAAELAANIAAGEIVKGAPVVVVKGRKVAHGTTGTVTWIGEDNYGKPRVGFKTSTNDIVYTALSNVALAI